MTTEITKSYAEEATRSLKELREIVESKNSQLSENREKIEKIEAFLDKFDELDQKRTQEFVDSRNKAIELEEKLVSLEKLAVMNSGSKDVDQTNKENVKKFYNFLHYGMKWDKQGVEKSNGLNTDEFKAMQGLKYMRTDIDVQGGTWAPYDIINELIDQNLVEISPIRSIARSMMTSLGEVYIPTKTSHTNALPTGEGASTTPSQMGTGVKIIKVNDNTVEVQYSIQMMQDSMFNFVQQVQDDVREQLAYREGQQFVSGIGIGNNEAFGFINNPGTGVGQSGVRVFETNTSLVLGSDDILLLEGQLKSQYNPTYVFNRRTKSYIRTLKGTNGQYYWPDIFAAGAPTTINSIPFVVANDMPDFRDNSGTVIAGTIPVALGDFYKGYRIVDHAALYVIRDDYTLASNGKIRMVFHFRVGGDIVVPESIVLLKIKA